MEFYDDMFNLDDKIVNHDDAKVFINEKYMDCEFQLDVRMFKIHQQRDEKRQKQIKRESKTNPYFTRKSVERVELIHAGNRNFVLQSLRERVMNWLIEY